MHYYEKDDLVIITGSRISARKLTRADKKNSAEVTDAFKSKYPEAQKVEWKAEITDFEATFNLNGFEMTAEFNSKGEWKESQKKMNFDALPDAVKDGFKKSKFNDWTPGSVTLIEKRDKTPEYKIYAEKSSLVQKRFLYFNEQGQLLREAPGV